MNLKTFVGKGDPLLKCMEIGPPRKIRILQNYCIKQIVFFYRRKCIWFLLAFANFTNFCHKQFSLKTAV
jgi:hypothetical protein